MDSTLSVKRDYCAFVISGKIKATKIKMKDNIKAIKNIITSYFYFSPTIIIKLIKGSS